MADTGRHGSRIDETCGVPVEEIRKDMLHGVREVNIDVRLAMTCATGKTLAEKPSECGLHAHLMAGTAATDIGRQRFEAFGGADPVSRILPVPLKRLAERVLGKAA